MDYRKSLLHKITHLSHKFKHARFGKLEQIGLYQGQPRLLHTLIEEDGISQRELAERMAITPATLTRMLQRMEAKHLLIRKADEKDQRVIRVHITAKARTIVEELDIVNEKMEEDLFGTFSPEDREHFISYLDNIMEKLDELYPRDKDENHGMGRGFGQGKGHGHKGRKGGRR